MAAELDGKKILYVKALKSLEKKSKMCETLEQANAEAEAEVESLNAVVEKISSVNSSLSLECESASKKLNDLSSLYQTLQNEFKDANSSKLALEKAVSELKNQCSFQTQLELSKQNLEKELSETRKQLADANSKNDISKVELESLKSALDSTAEKLSLAKKDYKNYIESYDKLKRENEKLKLDLETSKQSNVKTIDSINKKINQANSKAENLEKELKSVTETNTAEKQKLNAELDRVRNKTSNIENESNKLKAAYKKLKAEFDSISKEKEDLIVSLGSSKNSINEKENFIKNKAQEVKQLQTHNECLAKDLEKFKIEASKNTVEVEKLNAENAKLKSALDNLQCKFEKEESLKNASFMELEALKSVHQETKKSLQNVQNSYAEIESSRDDKSKKLEILEKQIEPLKQHIVTSKTEINEKNEELVSLKSEILQLQLQIKEMKERAFQQIQTQVKEIENLQHQIQELIMSHAIEIESVVKASEEKIALLKQSMELSEGEYSTTINSLNEKIQQETLKYAQIKQERNKFEQEVTHFYNAASQATLQYQVEKTELQAQINTYKGLLEKSEYRIKELLKEMAQRDQDSYDILSFKCQIQLYESMISNFSTQHDIPEGANLVETLSTIFERYHTEPSHSNEQQLVSTEPEIVESAVDTFAIRKRFKACLDLIRDIERNITQEKTEKESVQDLDRIQKTNSEDFEAISSILDQARGIIHELKSDDKQDEIDADEIQVFKKEELADLVLHVQSSTLRPKPSTALGRRPSIKRFLSLIRKKKQPNSILNASLGLKAEFKSLYKECVEPMTRELEYAKSEQLKLASTLEEERKRFIDTSMQMSSQLNSLGYAVQARDHYIESLVKKAEFARFMKVIE